MLVKKIESSKANVWLINTGWTGGPYGVGNRMRLKYTRAMINAALNGDLDNINYTTDKFFDLSIPDTCPNVPTELLNPRNTWEDTAAYDAKSKTLLTSFKKNYEQFEK